MGRPSVPETRRSPIAGVARVATTWLRSTAAYALAMMPPGGGTGPGVQAAGITVCTLLRWFMRFIQAAMLGVFASMAWPSLHGQDDPVARNAHVPG
jgi:hypothetical protein